MSEKSATKAEAGTSLSDVEGEIAVVAHEDSAKFQRNFGVWTFSAQAIVLPGSWAFAATSLTIAIFSGGAPVAIWGTIAISVCLCMVVACLAEFGSAYPSAAGCTYIAYKVAGPEWGRFCVSRIRDP
jgi:choline transport protein